MIESRSNARLKALRRARSGRSDHAVLEGPHLVSEAIATGIRLAFVLATEEFLATAAGQALAARLAEPPIVTLAKLLDEAADSDAPRGIVALAERPPATLDALPRRSGGSYLYLDGVQDPGNLGALARVAEAAGAAALLLAPGCAHPNHPRAMRGSAGSLLRFPAVRVTGTAAVDEALADLAPTWIALAARGGENLFAAPLEGSLILALGAEGPGLSAAVAARADRRITIPMRAPVESLNVATSAAVMLFERARRRATNASGSR